jgi:hypothetical protein
MLCQKCGLSEATVHRESTVFRQKIEEHLCEMCAGTGSSLKLPISTLPPRAKISRTMTMMHVVTVDKTGKTIREEVVDVPEPDHFPANGFDHIESYITRLVALSSRPKTIVIGTPDGNRAIFLQAQDGKTEVFLMALNTHQQRKREEAIRTFFKTLGIEPSKDYLAGNGGAPNSTRCLSYPIAGTVREVTELTKRILNELCGISPKEGLNIRFNDHGTS